MNTPEKFFEREDICFEKNVSAKSLCSFRVGGTVSYLAKPKDEQQFLSVATFLDDEKIKHIVLGRGSNVIFPDGIYDGVVVATGEMNNVSANGNTVTAESGASLFSLSLCAEKNLLSGLEFANGIPGSVGGAVYMNAGAYGSEISNVMVSCRCLDMKKRKITELGRSECGFSYRRSIFQEGHRLIVLSAKFVLDIGDAESIKQKMTEFRRRRVEKQPLEYPSAGSTFKRPVGNFAGKLIEDCGLKGFGFGGACVSEKHAGFIINRGNASADDVKRTVEYVKNKVFQETGTELECEVEFVE